MPNDPALVPLSERTPPSEFRHGLRRLLFSHGPYLTMYLPVGDEEQLAASAKAIEGAELDASQRAFARSLLAVERAGEDEMIAAFLAADGFSIVHSYPEGPSAPAIWVEALPRLAPLLEAEQRLRHHVLAVVDDEGIDLLSFPRHGRASHHRALPGDLTYTSLLISEAAKATGTHLVLIAAADDDADELVRLVSAEVPIETVVRAISADGGPEAVAEAAVAAVADDRAAATMRSIRQWKFERSHGLGAAGVVNAVDALRSDEPRLLIVHTEPDDERQAWFGPEPEHVAIDLEDAWVNKIDDSRPARLVDVAIRSALLRHIPIVSVPALPESTLPGGIGVLRAVTER